MPATRGHTRFERAEASSVNPKRKRSSSESPEPHNTNSDHRRNKRNRQTRSCVSCHINKRKCDRNAPCSRCRHLGTTWDCHYETEGPPPEGLELKVMLLRLRIGILEKIIRLFADKPEPGYKRPTGDSFDLEVLLAQEFFEDAVWILKLFAGYEDGPMTPSATEIKGVVQRVEDMRSTLFAKLSLSGNIPAIEDDIDIPHVPQAEPVPTFTMQHQLASGQLPYGQLPEAPGLSVSSDEGSLTTSNASPNVSAKASSSSPMPLHEVKVQDASPYEHDLSPLPSLPVELVPHPDAVPSYHLNPATHYYPAPFDPSTHSHHLHHPANDYHYTGAYYDDPAMIHQQPRYRPVTAVGADPMDLRDQAYPADYSQLQWSTSSDWRP